MSVLDPRAFEYCDEHALYVFLSQISAMRTEREDELRTGWDEMNKHNREWLTYSAEDLRRIENALMTAYNNAVRRDREK